jgi:hypothetical protein
MPDGTQQIDWQSDPDFHALPLIEKDKVLRKIDPDYAGLPPNEQVKALTAIHYGAQPQADTGGFVEKAADVIGRQVSGAAKQTYAPLTEAYEGYKTGRENGKGVLASAGNALLRGGAQVLKSEPGLPSMESGIETAVDTIGNWNDRKKAGYSPAYRALAPIAASAAGVNLPNMEAAAGRGDVKGVEAEAAVPVGEVALGETGGQLARLPAVQRAAGNASEGLNSFRNATARFARVPYEGGLRPWVPRVPFAKWATELVVPRGDEGTITNPIRVPEQDAGTVAPGKYFKTTKVQRAETPVKVYGPARVNRGNIEELNPAPKAYGPTRVNPEHIEELNPPPTPMGPTRVNARDIEGMVGRPGTAGQEAGYYPPVTRVPIRPEPAYKLTPESVPGPDTSGKGNLLSPLAKRGDPRAAQELMRRGRNVIYVPAEEDYPAPRSVTNFSRGQEAPVEIVPPFTKKRTPDERAAD